MFKKFFANNLSPKKYFENTNWQPPLKNKMAAQGDVIDDSAQELHLIVGAHCSKTYFSLLLKNFCSYILITSPKCLVMLIVFIHTD